MSAGGGGPARALADEGGWPQETIDRDYNARASVPLAMFEAAMADYRTRSHEMRPLLAHRNVVYDTASGQSIDIYGTADAPRPTFLFIHGGYWRALSKDDSSFMAAMLARHGIATAVVDYRLAPQVGLAEIVREVRAAAAFIWREGRPFGLDPDRLYAGGSSAGGHLTGALIAGGWHDAFGVPENVIKGAMPISGLFHLAPIARSFVREWLPLTEADVAALSPALHLPRIGCPLVIARGDGEPAGFHRQSLAFDALWRQVGFPSRLLEIENRNHFNVLLDLSSDDTALARALVELILG